MLINGYYDNPAVSPKQRHSIFKIQSIFSSLTQISTSFFYNYTKVISAKKKSNKDGRMEKSKRERTPSPAL